MATNLLIKSEGKYNFTERYLLPNARQNYNELVEKAHKDDAEPLVIAGPDGIWWNDDLVFVLERMHGDIHSPKIREWKEDIDATVWTDGLEKVYEDEGCKITVVADSTPMTNGVLYPL